MLESHQLTMSVILGQVLERVKQVHNFFKNDEDLKKKMGRDVMQNYADLFKKYYFDHYSKKTLILSLKESLDIMSELKLFYKTTLSIQKYGVSITSFFKVIMGYFKDYF